MDEHPVARRHTLVLQEVDVDAATHTGDIDLRQVSIGVEKLDHLTGDPKTHGSFLL
jgi:hypothetical protein